jgi:hypothetical protein
MNDQTDTLMEVTLPDIRKIAQKYHVKDIKKTARDAAAEALKKTVNAPSTSNQAQETVPAAAPRTIRIETPADLFGLFQHTVRLVEMKRSDKDKVLQRIQDEARIHNLSSEMEAVLKTRIIGSGKHGVSLSDQEWLDAPVITPRNEVVQAVNQHKLEAVAAQRKEKIYCIASIDVMRGGIVPELEEHKRRLLHFEFAKNREDLKHKKNVPSHSFHVCIGAKVTLTRN